HAGADDLLKECLIVVGNTRSVLGDVGASHAAPRAFKNRAAGKIHTRKVIALTIHRGVAIPANTNLYQISAALFWRADIRLRNRTFKRPWNGTDQIFHWEDEFRARLGLANRRN